MQKIKRSIKGNNKKTRLVKDLKATSSKKTYGWKISIWKDSQHHWFLGKQVKTTLKYRLRTFLLEWQKLDSPHQVLVCAATRTLTHSHQKCKMV